MASGNTISRNFPGTAPTSAACGERRVFTDTSAPHVLAKPEIARGVQCAYFLLGDLANSPAHLISKEGWFILMRAQKFCGWLYNSITLGGTPFGPGPWVAGGGL